MTNVSNGDKNLIDKEKLTAWYNIQAPLYHFWRDRYDDPLISHVANLTDRKIAQIVLDAGCGSGLYSIGLGLLQTNWHIEGIDRSNGLLRIARAQAVRRALRNVSFTNADVLVLPYQAKQFTLVVAAGLFPNLDDQRRTLHEFARLLCKDGQLVIVEFDRADLRGATKFFFRTMIFGYHIFTTIFRQYRFAKRWDIKASTINRNEFEDLLRQTGFSLERTIREHQHIIFLCRKP